MYGLTDIELSRLQHVFASMPEVKEAWLYGSRARGDYKPYSDLDITLVGDLSTSVLARLEGMLDDLLLPYHIDLSWRQRICNQALLDNIQRDGQQVYAAA